MWLLRSDQRLSEWKKFRREISAQSVEDAIASTSHLWSFAPYVNHYLDPADCGTWPDPWSIVAENYYCDLAKAVCMLYTLALCDHELDLELRIYEDEQHNFYHVVWIDNGRYITNLEFDTVVNKTQINDTLSLRHRYDSAALKLEQY